MYKCRLVIRRMEDYSFLLIRSDAAMAQREAI